MPLRPLNDVGYIPLLSLRPSEMQALEELPERDKDTMFPLFLLRPWTSAHNLSSALSRLESAYGDRACIVSPCDPEPVENRRPVHDELDELRDAAHGYEAWCRFIEDHPNFVPAIQYTVPEEVGDETERLHELGRGMLVHVRQQAIPLVAELAERIAAHCNGGEDVCFLLDYEKFTIDLLGRQLMARGSVQSILEAAPASFVAISASSFPDSFTDLTSQEIYERIFYNGVNASLASERLIYSDRGSARAERASGGSGEIPPRVDYAQETQWKFFRAADTSDRRGSYRRQAQRLMRDDCWDPELRIWGTQMIERTGLGDAAAIGSQAKATAVRINIHLHLQTFYDDPEGKYETDEEWRD